MFRYGAGYTQVGNAYNLQCRTWPARPFGENGEGVFRLIVALIRHTNGYNVRVTPIVDDVLLAPSSFSGGSPPGGQSEAIVRCEAWIQSGAQRGNRVEAIFETLAVLGETELVDLSYSAVLIRTAR